MSIVAGTITAVTGAAQAINPQTGEARTLSVGDQVFMDEVIETSAEGGVTVDLANGELLTVGRSTEMALDSDVLGLPSDMGEGVEGFSDIEALQEAILAGDVDIEDLPEAAAGEGDVSSSNAGALNVVNRIGATGEVTSGFDTTGLAAQVDEGLEQPGQQLVSASLTLTATPQLTEDGGVITYTVFVDNVPQTDMTVTLSNGQTMVIPAGQTSGSTQVTILEEQFEDVYNDQDSIDVTVTGASGGNFQDIDYSEASASTVIVDTIDTTEVTLDTADVNEDSGEVTFTATLGHPGQTDVTVSTDRGDIVIPAGQVSGSLSVDMTDPDVYIDPQTVSATVTGVSGGNFEAVDYSEATAMANVTDTIDTTEVTLDTADVNEDSGEVTFTATLDHPGQTDVTVSTDRGDIVIPAGQVSGSLSVDMTDPDVYIDPQTVSATVTGVSGGNFEAVDYSEATAMANVTDTIDTTYVSLSAFGGDDGPVEPGNGSDLVGSTVEEGENALYQVTVSNPPQTDYTVQIALSHIDTDSGDVDTSVTIPVTIPAGLSSAVFSVANIENFLVEPNEDYQVELVPGSDSGGNYEHTVLDSTPVITTIIDDDSYPVAQDDPEGGQAYYVEVGNVDESKYGYEWSSSGVANWNNQDSNGQTVTIKAFNAFNEEVDLTADTEVLVSGDSSGIQVEPRNDDYELGVAGSPRDGGEWPAQQIEYHVGYGTSEAVEITFSGNMNEATVILGHLIEAENEQGRWIALLDGSKVAEGILSDTQAVINTGSLVFNQLRFEALPYSEGDGSSVNSDSSDYFIQSVQASGPAWANFDYQTTEDTPLVIDEVAGLLPNDADADGDSLGVIKVNGNAVNTGDTVTLTSGAEVTINANGSFNYNPNGAFDDLDAGEITTDSFTYSIEDEHGNTLISAGGEGPNTDSDSMATATITIVGKGEPYVPDEPDLFPLTEDESQDMVFVSEPQDTNIVITLDISGSMVNPGSGGVIPLPGGGTTTRLALAKEALVNMIESYDDMGEVQVKLVTFDWDATDYGWLSAQDAMSTINGLSGGGNTNYEDAVLKTYDGYSDALPGVQTVAYFISDGKPTVENSGGGGSGTAGGYLDIDYENGWNAFIADYVDELYVVALGPGSVNTYLDVLADAGDDFSDVVDVDDETDLEQVIDPTTVTVSGDLTDNVSGGDGEISFDSVEVGGTIYTAADFSGGSTVPIGGDGELSVDFGNGTYSYTASSSEFDENTEKSFTVYASDEDGDVASFEVTINIQFASADPEVQVPVFQSDGTDVGGASMMLAGQTIEQEASEPLAEDIKVHSVNQASDLVVDGVPITLSGDAPHNFSWNLAAAQIPELYSNGERVVVTEEGGQIVGRTESGGDLVFELAMTLNEGTSEPQFAFNQHQAMNEGMTSEAADSDIDTTAETDTDLSMEFPYEVSDIDGDTADASVTVNLYGDNESGLVYEGTDDTQDVFDMDDVGTNVTITNYDIEDDVLEITDVVDENVTDENLDEYMTFESVDSDSDGQDDTTKITIDEDANSGTTDDVTTLYIQDDDDEIIEDIDDMNIDYQDQ